MEQLCLSLRNTNVRGYNHRWSVIVDLYSKLSANIHASSSTHGAARIACSTIEKLLMFEDELDEWIDSKMSAEEVVDDQEVIDELIIAKSARERNYMGIYIQRMFNIVKYLYDIGSA
jgi:hypothetical protein